MCYYYHMTHQCACKTMKHIFCAREITGGTPKQDTDPICDPLGQRRLGHFVLTAQCRYCQDARYASRYGERLEWQDRELGQLSELDLVPTEFKSRRDTILARTDAWRQVEDRGRRDEAQELKDATRWICYMVLLKCQVQYEPEVMHQDDVDLENKIDDMSAMQPPCVEVLDLTDPYMEHVSMMEQVWVADIASRMLAKEERRLRRLRNGGGEERDLGTGNIIHQTAQRGPASNKNHTRTSAFADEGMPASDTPSPNWELVSQDEYIPRALPPIPSSSSLDIDGAVMTDLPMRDV